MTRVFRWLVDESNASVVVRTGRYETAAKQIDEMMEREMKGNKSELDCDEGKAFDETRCGNGS